MPARTSSPALRADLREFSNGLAARLPGSWNAVVVEDFHDHPLRKDVLGRLWDDGHVAWAVGDFVHERAALLAGPGETILLAVRRPLRPGQFLIAPLAPPGAAASGRHAFAPAGIAVPADPARAAAAVQQRLLLNGPDGPTAVSDLAQPVVLATPGTVPEQRSAADQPLRQTVGFTATPASTKDPDPRTPAQSSPDAAGLFVVVQDGTLHFTVPARNLDDAYARISDLESTQAAVEVALGDGVQLTHITYGTVDATDIIPPVDRGTTPAPGSPVAGLLSRPHHTSGAEAAGDTSRVAAANCRSPTAGRTGPAGEPRDSPAPRPEPVSAPRAEPRRHR
ncbi:hypothetical protein VSR01_22520 [Actinacidiphila sp. DG2A-62]|uniref:hypothetical protein n=1 Tax=Actinacidiphila sp. DG2A-62 TaxID=3108821 RepID=UPI002DBA316B|nr:hypothetical protein [Actinacidiphila sp. DG2A-62]MEC3996137.1 hypothetical protein [Actinacidiphila sp. DG2A-62]